MAQSAELVLREEAEADLAEAYRWYESKRTGLGVSFVDEVEAAFARIAAAPRSFALAHRDVRRLVMGRFPYIIYFRGDENMIEVVGVLHGRRDPGVARGR